MLYKVFMDVSHLAFRDRLGSLPFERNWWQQGRV